MAVIVFFISGARPSLLPQYLLINLIAMASFLPYGFLTAVFARDQNSVNVYSMLSVVIAFIIPIFSYWKIPDRGIRQGSEQCKCIQYA